MKTPEEIMKLISKETQKKEMSLSPFGVWSCYFIKMLCVIMTVSIQYQYSINIFEMRIKLLFTKFYVHSSFNIHVIIEPLMSKILI